MRSFNDLTISSTVDFSKTGSSFIVAGGQGGTGTNTKDYTVKNSTVTLNAGQWSEVIGSVRSSLNSPSGAHSPDEFKDYTIVINVGGSAVISKLAAFSRSFTTAAILARNSECVINLNGGQINCWIAMSDSTAEGKNGYEDGIIINIGKNFDLSKSFRSSIDKQENTILDNVFYGINGDSPFATGNQTPIGASKIYIAEEKYDEYKDSDRFRGVTVLSGKYIPARNPESGDCAWMVVDVAIVAMAGAVLTIKKKKEN